MYDKSYRHGIDLHYIFFYKILRFLYLYTNDAEQALKPHASLPKTYPWSHGTEMSVKT
jgi:hypothetical protein